MEKNFSPHLAPNTCSSCAGLKACAMCRLQRLSRKLLLQIIRRASAFREFPVMAILTKLIHCIGCRLCLIVSYGQVGTRLLRPQGFARGPTAWGACGLCVSARCLVRDGSRLRSWNLLKGHILHFSAGSLGKPISVKSCFPALDTHGFVGYLKSFLMKSLFSVKILAFSREAKDIISSLFIPMHWCFFKSGKLKSIDVAMCLSSFRTSTKS